MQHYCDGLGLSSHNSFLNANFIGVVHMVSQCPPSSVRGRVSRCCRPYIIQHLAKGDFNRAVHEVVMVKKKKNVLMVERDPFILNEGLESRPAA